MRTGALVLAAGAGRRFGGGPKQLAPLDGRPLLSHAVSAVLAVPELDPVVVVLGHEASRVRAGVPELAACEVVIAEDWESGQSASLRAGVAALEGVDAALVALGDMPYVTPQVIAGVLDAAAPAGVAPRAASRAAAPPDAVRATYRGEPGHPVLLTRALLRRVGELRGDEGFRRLLAGVRVGRFEAGHLADPTDIDTREELARR